MQGVHFPKNLRKTHYKFHKLIHSVFECMQAPIFVNKEIVLTDAIRMVHGMARSSNAKAIYDVSLDRFVLVFPGTYILFPRLYHI